VISSGKGSAITERPNSGLLPTRVLLRELVGCVCAVGVKKRVCQLEAKKAMEMKKSQTGGV